MSVRNLSVAALMIVALTGSAAADTPDDANGRYTMSPVDGGFLRLDKQTGAVAMCAKAGSDWACKSVEDRTVPTAPADELAKLEDENKELKERVKALEDALETGKPSAPMEGPPHGKVQLPTDEEVDQALDYLEHIYKKVRDKIKELDKPLPPSPPGADAPPKGSL